MDFYVFMEVRFKLIRDWRGVKSTVGFCMWSGRGAEWQGAPHSHPISFYVLMDHTQFAYKLCKFNSLRHYLFIENQSLTICRNISHTLYCIMKFRVELKEIIKFFFLIMTIIFNVIILYITFNFIYSFRILYLILLETFSTDRII